MLGLSDPYEAYCVDEAVAYFGNSVEHELQKIEGKNEAETTRRRTALLERYLFPDDKPTQTGFADPALLFG